MYGLRPIFFLNFASASLTFLSTDCIFLSAVSIVLHADSSTSTEAPASIILFIVCLLFIVAYIHKMPGNARRCSHCRRNQVRAAALPLTPFKIPV